MTQLSHSLCIYGGEISSGLLWTVSWAVPHTRSLALGWAAIEDQSILPLRSYDPSEVFFLSFQKGLISSPSPWTHWGCSCPKVNPSFNSYKCNLRLAAAWDPYGSAWISPHFPQRQATWLTAPSHSEYRKVSFKKEVGWKNKEYRQDKKMRVTNRPLASVLWMTSTEGFLHFPWEASQ